MFCADGLSRPLRPRRRGTRLGVAGVFGVVASLAVVACGSSSPPKTIDSVALERSIARSILAEHHLNTKVTCPANVAQQKGHTFNCYALLQVGRYRVPVTQVNGHGDVRWHTSQPITLLDTPRVEQAIASSINKQRKVTAKVTCPAQVLQAAGVTFTCTAVTQGGAKVPAGRYPFKVTQTDGAGHVTYIEG
jgi:Domain of unknown function (DUF4333)